MKLFITQFPLASSHLVSLRPKYLPSHPVAISFSPNPFFNPRP